MGKWRCMDRNWVGGWVMWVEGLLAHVLQYLTGGLAGTVDWKRLSDAELYDEDMLHFQAFWRLSASCTTTCVCCTGSNVCTKVCNAFQC